ncbi:MAG: hypothetical protein AABZ39_07930 [Spirochaetota bacterium]
MDTQTPETKKSSSRRSDGIKTPVIFCSLFTVIALIGCIVGLVLKMPVIVIAGLLPTAVYEVIRTAGVSTKAASVTLLVVLILDMIFVLFGVSINLSKLLGTAKTTISGYAILLGDIRVVAAGLMAVLSVILVLRTQGIYTKWLAGIIFITSFLVIYMINPADFQKMLALAIEQIKSRVRL